MKKKRLLLKTLAVAIFSGLSLVAVQAWSNPLIGSWEHTEPATPQGPQSTMKLIFTDDGTFEYDAAIASGFTVSKGVYQLKSDSSFVSEIKSSMMCAAGSPCMPNPMPVQYNVPTTGNFQVQDQGHLIIDNVTWTRIN